MRLWGRAAVIAGSYVVLATVWILGSGALASAVATSAAELERIEQIKGLLFVAGTGALLLVASWFVLRRLELELEHKADERETLLKLERHSLAGLFVSSIAHDANNVATVVKSALTELGNAQLDDDGREALHDAKDSLARLQQLFADLKTMGRFDEKHHCEERDLVELVQRAVTLLRGHSVVKHCRVTVVAPEPVRLTLEPSLVDQMLINLVINAADATSGRGRVELRVLREGSDALLEVHDDGPGVPEAQQAQLFRAFKTTKPHGTGLGLLSVRECAQRHKGTVSYARSPLGGACFVVRMPLVK